MVTIENSKLLLCALVICLVTPAYTQSYRAVDSLFQAAEEQLNVLTPTVETDKKALSLYSQAIRLRKEITNNEPDSLVAVCHQRVGVIYQDWGNLERALENYRACIKIKQKLFLSSNLSFLEDFTLIGTIHYYKGRYDSALYYFTLGEYILSSTNQVSIAGEDRLLNSLGVLHFSLGNYSQAINYYERALMVTDKQEADFKKTEIYFNTNIAKANKELGRFAEAVILYKKLIEKGIATSILYQQLGDVYKSIHQYDSAKLFLSKAINSQHLSTKIDAQVSLAAVYLVKQNIDSARLLLRASVNTINEQNETNAIWLSEAYSGLAQLYQAQNDFDSTLHYYQLALINTTFDFNDSTVTENPTDITQAISLLHLFDVLRGKAAVWYQYYQQDQDRAKLEHALVTYQLAIRTAQHIRKTYDNDEAKLFLVNKVAPVYEEAVAVAVKLHELTGEPRYVAQAFQFSEASKAAVLAEGLRDVKIKASGGVNDSLVQEERRIKQQITALRLKLVASQDSTRNESYRQQLIDQEIALARTIKYLQKDEQYYRRKYQPDTLDLAALQRSVLDDDEALLEYFVGRDQLYLFWLRTDDLRVAAVARTAELDSALHRTRRQLYDFQPGQEEDKASLAVLYRYLIAPVATDLTQVDRLTVVPDGPLHYLPFDLLSEDGQRENYLLQTHTLHYGYSASLLRQATDERRGFPTEAVLAMAPFAGEAVGGVRSRGFSLLRDSKAEVEQVGGSVYTEGKATKREFLRVAGSYNVLHLATHATVNDEDPLQSFIAFYPQQRDSVADYRLYTHELYNMQLDSVKLVVLSACEAGNGRLVRGEGVMSLARAFAYAGCPNIVTTLWKADDRSSAYLTARMHNYLKEGKGKDEALRLAKLDYLADEDVLPSQKNPYYWAHFVFIGDPAPLYDDHRIWWWLGGGLLLLLVMGSLLMRRKQGRIQEMA